MLSNSISSFSSIISNIKRNSNQFSFVDVLANAVTNNRFLEGKKQLDAGQNNENTFLWRSLSAVGQDIGEVLYSNVLNYIDNVSNIDLCKITALRSMMKAYGIKYTIFDNFNTVPKKIQDIIDVMSINKRYFKRPDVINYMLIRSMFISKDGKVVDDMLTKNEAIQLLYRNFRNKFNVIDTDDNVHYPFHGEYTLSIDNSYDDINCCRNNELSLNILREYAGPKVNLTYKDFSDTGHIPSGYNLSCVQISADFQAQYSIKKFNFNFENDIIPEKVVEYTYGLFENKTIDYYWKIPHSTGILDIQHEKFISQNDDLIGILHNFEETVNPYSFDRVSQKDLFTDMDPQMLVRKLMPFTDYADELSDNNSYAEEIGYKKAAILSSIADYGRISALSNINSTEFNFQFEIEGKKSIDDVIIDETKYYNFLSSIYYCHLLEVCKMKYIPEDVEELVTQFNDAYIDVFGKEIYKDPKVSAEFFPYSTLVDLSRATKNKEFKLKNGIELSFDEKKIVDNIEVGADSEDNYEGAKLELIQNEIQERHSLMELGTISSDAYVQTNAKDLNNILNLSLTTSRMHYYKKELVKQYVKFIESLNYMSNVKTLNNNYVLDNDYVEIDYSSDKYKTLINVDESTNELSLNDFMIKYAANQLADLTIYIANIREKLKIQAVKYYMKGTFNLLSYAINEYLIEFANSNIVMRCASLSDDFSNQVIQEQFGLSGNTDYQTEQAIRKILVDVKKKLSEHMYDDIKIVEYDDSSEYYNIKTDTSVKAKNVEKVNYPYWQSNDILSAETQSLEFDAIQHFYMNQLKCNTTLSSTQLYSFLKALYEIGADETYIDKTTGELVLDADSYRDGDNKNEELQYYTYTGTEEGYHPYYNIKNQTHPSYQVHPYLYGFVEVATQIFSIENAFKNGLVDDIIQQKALDALLTNVGKYGQIQNIWKNNAFDFSGYKTSYELGDHEGRVNSDVLVECADYDGMFYPPAIQDLIDAVKKANGSYTNNAFINSVANRSGSYYDRYYKHLSMTDDELNATVNRLIEYTSYILDIVEEKVESTYIFDIYKYATDKYGNAYGLYKQYTNRTFRLSIESGKKDIITNWPQSYSEKENTLGQLWIRLKDHPIAFPAFFGKNPIFSKKKNEKDEEQVHIVWQLAENNNPVTDSTGMKYFYDMEFDTSKQILFLNSNPINYVLNSCISSTLSAEIADNMHNNYDVLNTLENSKIIICNILQDVEVKTGTKSLYVTHDEVQNIDTIFDIYDKFVMKATDSSSNAAGISACADISGHLMIDAFVGYCKDSSSTTAAYIVKHYWLDENGIIKRNMFPLMQNAFVAKMSKYTKNSKIGTYTFQSQPLNLNTFADGKYNLYELATGKVRFNYNDNDLVFGFLSKLKSTNTTISATSFVGKTVGKSRMSYPIDAQGYSIELSEIADVNSFDAFDKFVTILDAKIIQDEIVFSDINMFNLNSDASYIPQYPGENGKNLLYKTNRYGNSKDYISLELLGKSKKLSEIVDLIDPNASVEYDVDTLKALKDSIPGRIYENSESESFDSDELLTVYDNPNIINGDGKYDKLSSIEWNIPLEKFTISQLPGVEMLIFNGANSGKNAYFQGSIADLSNAMVSGVVVSAQNYISSDVVSEVRLSTNIAEITVAGTFNCFDNPVNKSDTNHINNISSMQFEFVQSPADISALTPRETKSKSNIRIKLAKVDPNKKTYIAESTIRVVLYNKFNLRQYEFYHYFDERGIVKYDRNEPNYESAYIDIDDLDDGLYLIDVDKTFTEDELCAMTTHEYNKYDYTTSSTVPVSSRRIYLKDIALSSYNYLSDVAVLKDRQNLSFKYSEEDVFQRQHTSFYYPGYNMIYPSMNMSMFSLSASQAIDTSNMFNQQNMFIVQLENSRTFANKVGNVDIPLEYNEGNCLRVYEDYDRDITSIDDPAILSSVHFITTEAQSKFDEVEIDGKLFLSAYETITVSAMPISDTSTLISVVNASDIPENKLSDLITYTKSLEGLNTDSSILNLMKHGFYNINTESLTSDIDFDKISFNCAYSNTDFKDFMDIYVNYEVTKLGTIKLFFNYYNFMNSPFITYENGKQRIRAIDGTYLALDRGESGLLDIDVQFKAYFGNCLYGIKTGTLVTYKLFNVSDDKPKFVIYKMSEISKGSLSELGNIDADASFYITNTYIDLDDNDLVDENGKINVKIKLLLQTSMIIEAGAEFTIMYSLKELTFGSGIECPGFVCVVNENKNDAGTFGTITLTATKNISNVKSIIISGKTVETKGNIVLNNITTYDLTVTKAEAKTIEKEDVEFVTSNGSVLFGYKILLRRETTNDEDLVSIEHKERTLPSFIITRQV